MAEQNRNAVCKLVLIHKHLQLKFMFILNEGEAGWNSLLGKFAVYNNVRHFVAQGILKMIPCVAT